MTEVYLDTSALAKWYLNEPFSEESEAFIHEQPAAAISRLTVVEFRCLLARRQRAGEITKAIESRVQAAFERDIGDGFLQVHPVADQHLVATADNIMADAGRAAGLAVARFSSEPGVRPTPVVGRRHHETATAGCNVYQPPKMQRAEPGRARIC